MSGPEPFSQFDERLVRRCAEESAEWHEAEAKAHHEAAATHPQSMYGDIHLAMAAYLRSMFAPDEPCTHRHYSYDKHGRRCPCGTLMVDFGD